LASLAQKFGMKLFITKSTIVGTLLCGSGYSGLAQDFQNLDFESANLTGYPPGSTVPASNAFPGWTVNAQYIIYDDVSLSGNSISIFDSNPPLNAPPIQGAYYAALASGNTPGLGQTISLSQNGTIPVGTQSMTFWGSIGGLQISFAGQALAFSETGSTANYNIYAANISAFAGQSGQLLFSVPAYVSSAALDNIQFSASPVPEPNSFGLFALGGLLLVWRHWRKPS
jgi:hypothetical protein